MPAWGPPFSRRCRPAPARRGRSISARASPTGAGPMRCSKRAPEEVTGTAGATEAPAAAILALVEPGDEVICFQPLYDAYVPLIERAGGVARLVGLTPPHWRVDAA